MIMKKMNYEESIHNINKKYLKRCSSYSTRELLMLNKNKIDVAEMCRIARINCKKQLIHEHITMEYTEEVKTESDSVVLKYEGMVKLTAGDVGELKGNVLHLKTVKATTASIICAIQDRQSVLEALNKYEVYFEDDCQSLTQQISYLKSKL